jgi:hypothetical protein
VSNYNNPAPENVLFWVFADESSSSFHYSELLLAVQSLSDEDFNDPRRFGSLADFRWKLV